MYLSLEDEAPVGFQLKDIRALIDIKDIDMMSVQVGYNSENKRLISIEVLMLGFKAYGKIPENNNPVRDNLYRLY